MQQHNDLSNIVYRIESVEKDIVALRQQLTLYEPTRENDLKLQIIKDTTLRIETELGKVKEKVESINVRMIAQENDIVKSYTKTKEASDKLQIRILWYVVSGILGLGGAVLVGFLTHIIGR
jgi:hypothetical protein